MKKYVLAMLFLCSAVLLSGCKRSNIKASDDMPLPDDVLVVNGQTEPPAIELHKGTYAYTIPDDAQSGVYGGPGVMESNVVDQFSDYPENRQPDEMTGILAVYYFVNNGKLKKDFDNLEVCDPDTVIGMMVKGKVLGEGTEVTEYKTEGRKGILTINKLESAFGNVTESDILSCIANTFIDNFDLDAVEISAGGDEFGEFTFTD